jgi:MYXO-CTERM domain-containing protein
MRTKLSMQALAALIAVVPFLSWSAPVHAAAACTVDTDCAGTACGTPVCQWVNGAPVGCVAAGTDPQGSDGWCDTATDCKCAAQGATCGLSSHCSITLPPDGGAAESDAAATATDAASSTEASTTTPESDASTTVAPPESDATVATGDSGTSEPSSGGGKSGGCSIAAPGGAGSAPLAALVGIALAGAFLARKRRS